MLNVENNSLSSPIQADFHIWGYRTLEKSVMRTEYGNGLPMVKKTICKILQGIIMDEIIIRPATENDLPTLFQFEQGIIGAERPYDPTLKEGTIHYYDLAAMIGSDVARIAVAECDGKLVGAGSARKLPALPFVKHSFHAHLGFMFVDPDFRGRGVIQLIMEALKNWAIEKKLNIIRLEVYAGNAPAIRAYAKMGFAPNLVEMTMDVSAEIKRSEKE